MPEIAVPKVQKLRFLNSYFFGNLEELAYILNYVYVIHKSLRK